MVMYRIVLFRVYILKVHTVTENTKGCISGATARLGSLDRAIRDKSSRVLL